jgi:hypothetical protein
MQDAQGYVARCTSLSTSSSCLVVWSARVLMLRSILQNNRWNGVVTNLKAIDEKELTKEKVARVLTEWSMELKAKLKTPSTQNLTLAVGNYKNVVCYQCNQKGHISRNCVTQCNGEHDRTRENERNGGRREAEKLKQHGRFPAQKQETIPKLYIPCGRRQR